MTLLPVKIQRTTFAITALMAAVFICANPVELWAQRTKSSLKAGEQRNAQKGLKDNQIFFHFINSSVTNTGNDEQIKLFKEAVQRDMIARILYMKFAFHESWTEIRRSQSLLIELYRITLKKDISSARTLLGGFAPPVITAGNHRSKHYLRLGYRNAVEAEQFMAMGDSFTERLYSMRLYKYTHAIKKAKLSRRYAFLAALEQNGAGKNPDEIRIKIDQIYTRMHTSGEEKTKELRKELSAARKELVDANMELGHLGFSALKDMISELPGAAESGYTTYHYDNYYRTPDGGTLFDKVWDNPQLDSIPEYAEYLKKH